MLRFISFATSAVGVFAFECARNTIKSSSLNCVPIVHPAKVTGGCGIGPTASLAKAARRGLARYCFTAGGFASGAGAGAAVSGERVVPRSSDASAQSPAQSLVPLTVPTSLQPIGTCGFICFNGLPPTLGAAV